MIERTNTQDTSISLKLTLYHNETLFWWAYEPSKKVIIYHNWVNGSH